jgi:hypothetical protein
VVTAFRAYKAFGPFMLAQIFNAVIFSAEFSSVRNFRLNCLTLVMEYMVHLLVGTSNLDHDFNIENHIDSIG